MAQEPFVPTLAQRRLVELAVSSRMSEDRIAAQLGISRPTLRKHFAKELQFGHDKVRLQSLQRLDSAAARGNVSAIKAQLARVDAEPVKDPPAKRQPKAKPVGKKAAAVSAAAEAHKNTGWHALLSTDAPVN